MKDLAFSITLPGFNTTSGVTVINSPSDKFTTLGGFLSGSMEVVFYAVGFLMAGYLAWGVFRYITAEGQKESLFKARNHMRWAFVGFIVVMLAFVVAKYFQEVIPQQTITITNVDGTK